jgi:hypothetical protein
MPRDPNSPDAFDVQARHLAHRAELRRQGLVVVNGPGSGGSLPARSTSR